MIISHSFKLLLWYLLIRTHRAHTDNGKIITDGQKSQSDQQKFIIIIIIKWWLIRTFLFFSINLSLSLYHTIDYTLNRDVILFVLLLVVLLLLLLLCTMRMPTKMAKYSIPMKIVSRPENSLSFFFLCPFFLPNFKYLQSHWLLFMNRMFASDKSILLAVKTLSVYELIPIHTYYYVFNLFRLQCYRSAYWAHCVYASFNCSQHTRKRWTNTHTHTQSRIGFDILSLLFLYSMGKHFNAWKWRHIRYDQRYSYGFRACVYKSEPQWIYMTDFLRDDSNVIKEQSVKISIF